MHITDVGVVAGERRSDTGAGGCGQTVWMHCSWFKASPRLPLSVSGTTDRRPRDENLWFGFEGCVADDVLPTVSECT